MRINAVAVSTSNLKATVKFYKLLGFLFPEFTQSATQPEATEVKQKEFEGYYSTSKTCEIAMSDAVGKNYQSILSLVDECI